MELYLLISSDAEEFDSVAYELIFVVRDCVTELSELSALSEYLF